MTDARELMGRYCDGDANAFRELYALLAPRLLGYLMKMGRDRALAADLLQQTFMKVHRARGSYIREADPAPWFYSIAHRTFLDFARKRMRDIVELEAHRELPELHSDLQGESLLRGAPADSELVTAVLAALAELPCEQREAVVLTKLEGKSLAEAAEITGASVGAMKVRAHRGYRALRDVFGTGPEARELALRVAR
jgi:RNA polymerase sigma-70 factor, ECF subfamily